MGTPDFKDSTFRVDPRGEGSGSPTDGDGHTPYESPARPDLARTRSAMSTTTPIVYKVYKRRFIGLMEIILLNIMASWGWTIFSPISDTVATYFGTTETAVNWLSIVYFFAYVVAAPATSYTLSRKGPKMSIMVCAILLLIGNWVKYAGAKTNQFPVVMLGQIFVGLAQPFVLAAPTTYSDMWFSGAGRTSATAVASLANPLGAALGQLVAPFWTSSPSDVPNVVLYTAVISTVVCIPTIFIPARPPTPPTAGTSDATKSVSLITEMRILLTSLEFYLLWIPFSVYVGFFNAFASLLNQMLQPYGFTEDEAGLAGAVLIFVGLVWTAVLSPFIDKYKFYLLYIKIAVPVLALMYLVFIWAPASRSIAYVYVVCALLGSASFGLVPVTLEYLVEIHYPLEPEASSSLCWAGGQFLGGIFTIIMDQLKSNYGGPESNMHRALIFQAVVGLAIMPLPVALGWFGRASHVRKKRWEVEQRQRGTVDIEEEDEETVLNGEGHGHVRI